MSKKTDKDLLNLPIGGEGSIKSKVLGLARTVLEHTLKFPQLNKLYREIAEREDDRHFCDRLLEALNVEIKTGKGEIDRIPEEGPVVVVANHPFGAIEGALLASLLLKRRPDVKILTNSLLGHVPDLDDLCIYVDPFGKKESVASNARPLVNAIKWVRNGGLLAVFPSGEVSHLQVTKRKIIDPPWLQTVGRIIQKTGAIALPIYFQGSNSFLFQVAGLVHKRLRTVMLPREFLNKKNKVFRVAVGNPIPRRKLDSFESEAELTEYLRKRTYLLQNKFLKETRGGGASSDSREEKLEKIVEPLPPEEVHGELNSLDDDCLLVEGYGFQVFCERGDRIPALMHEIGRLREITFRKVGEGTGLKIDTDEFDKDYYQLFVWDPKKENIVGAYRIGRIDKIIERKGLNGLYINTLYEFDEELFDSIDNSLELGRSFVVPEYQRSFAPLMLLWKGIGHFTCAHPEYRYLVGPVSINDNYSIFSRQLMISYLKETNFLHELAKHVKPRSPFKNRKIKGYKTGPISSMVTDIEELSNLITDFEDMQNSVPVLLRQYLKLGGKILAFNVDPSSQTHLTDLSSWTSARRHSRCLRSTWAKTKPEHTLSNTASNSDIDSTHK
ncbi:MAG: GNAT family N-acyltransferase [Planctomycetota bacterium]|nr:GNAT family N-acyltransferase [Planctomycetota bacterium]